jgi:hypothetical protein
MNIISNFIVVPKYFKFDLFSKDFFRIYGFVNSSRKSFKTLSLILPKPEMIHVLLILTVLISDCADFTVDVSRIFYNVSQKPFSSFLFVVINIF